VFRFPITCSGGIGDTLLALASVPIAAWGRCGVRFNIFHEQRDHPAWNIVRGFADSLQYCRVLDRSPTLTECRMRNAWQRMTRHWQSLYAPPIPAAKGREVKVSGERRILLQSHLDGHHGHTAVLAKKWPVDRWCDLCDALHRSGWTVELLEWDVESFTAISRSCPFVADARRPSLLETIQNMRGLDCVVSVDSWTKYVAGWWCIPQVVIVPDLRRRYTPLFETLTADEVARGWFRGLLFSPATRLIGLEKKKEVFEYTLPSIEMLPAQDVAKAAQAVADLAA